MKLKPCPQGANQRRKQLAALRRAALIAALAPKKPAPK